MSSAKPPRLRFESCDHAADIEGLSDVALSIMVDDIIQKQLPVLSFESIPFACAATFPRDRMREKDVAAVVGGAAGFAKWTAFHLTHIAVQTDYRHRGVGTALLKAVEEAARTTFRCNQVRVEVMSWQARSFFEKAGYRVEWTLENHPPGHSKAYMVKDWQLASREDAVTGYAAAAKDVRIDAWRSQDAKSLLSTWIEEDRARQGLGNVPPDTQHSHGLRVWYPDGSLAAVCVYHTYWNMLHVVMLTVLQKSGYRRGVGSATLRKLLDVARQQHCDHVTLKTMSWQARGFYEKNGFALVINEKDVPLGFDRYTMYRRIPSADLSKL